jgi:PPK2 family polyphosphate:nucleotide phosphotransferase
VEITMHDESMFRVKPGDKLRLKDIDPNYKGHHVSEQEAADEIEHHRQKMAKMQAVLYAEKKRSVLVVLQALDAAGKDGTVNHVLSALNPQGAAVAGFKKPTPDELDHDFLWRVHPHVPGKGQIAIFNRSHYEDVLVTRVHKLIDKATWLERYHRICQFEDLLIENGTHILKFYLHISKEEQLARFAERLKDSTRLHVPANIKSILGPSFAFIAAPHRPEFQLLGRQPMPQPSPQPSPQFP